MATPKVNSKLRQDGKIDKRTTTGRASDGKTESKTIAKKILKHK